MPDDVEVPLPGTKEMAPEHDDEDIESNLDPETAYCLANLIDAAKAHGLYPFGHTRQALKLDAVAQDDESSLREFRDSLREQPGVQRVTRERLAAMGIGLGSGT
jgi:translation elongation factor EF-1beta